LLNQSIYIHGLTQIVLIPKVPELPIWPLRCTQQRDHIDWCCVIRCAMFAYVIGYWDRHGMRCRGRLRHQFCRRLRQQTTLKVSISLTSISAIVDRPRCRVG